jgi:hypothetical protein
MPVTYQIDPSRKLIHTRCIGDVTPEEIARHFRELEPDPGRPERLNVLLDLTEETSLPETQDLTEVKYQLNKLLRSVRFGACTIVASVLAVSGRRRELDQDQEWQLLTDHGPRRTVRSQIRPQKRSRKRWLGRLRARVSHGRGFLRARVDGKV